MRNDTGVFEGGEISMFYDPMIAKLCSWAPTRLDAIDAMQPALDQFEVEGIGNNIPFLSRRDGQDRFREGRLTTGYIAEEFKDGFTGVDLATTDLTHLAALACVSAYALDTRTHVGSDTRRAVLIGEHRWDFSGPRRRHRVLAHRSQRQEAPGRVRLEAAA